MNVLDESFSWDVPGDADLVRRAMSEAGVEDQLGPLDDHNGIEAAAVAIRQLLEMEGAQIVGGRDAPGVAEEDLPEAYAIFRGKYHINTRKAAWRGVVGLVPVIVQLIRAQVDPTAYLSAAGSVLGGITAVGSAVQQLAPEEVALCLAIRAAGEIAGAQELAARLGGVEGGWDEARVSELLKALTGRGVVARKNGGYRVV